MGTTAHNFPLAAGDFALVFMRWGLAWDVWKLDWKSSEKQGIEMNFASWPQFCCHSKSGKLRENFSTANRFARRLRKRTV
jgi:hypothetical protein